MTVNKLSPAGLRLIQNYEGCRLVAYKPVEAEQYWTIGWGHYGPDVKMGQRITQEQADAMLVNDLNSYVDGVNKLVKVDINQNQFDALVSFAYNCGVGGLQKSTLLTLVNQKNFVAAANEFPKWCHGAGGVVLQGLLNRRNKERELFLTPVVKEVPEVDKITVKYSTDGSHWLSAQVGFVHEGTSYVPVRVIAEALGATVAWDAKTQTVTILPKK
jgi:GH24 family phage-related lysozyme (muramidase)